MIHIGRSVVVAMAYALVGVFMQWASYGSIEGYTIDEVFMFGCGAFSALIWWGKE